MLEVLNLLLHLVERTVLSHVSPILKYTRERWSYNGRLIGSQLNSTVIG